MLASAVLEGRNQLWPCGGDGREGGERALVLVVLEEMAAQQVILPREGVVLASVMRVCRDDRATRLAEDKRAIGRIDNTEEVKGRQHRKDRAGRGP